MSYGTAKAVAQADEALKTVVRNAKGYRNGNQINSIRAKLLRAFRDEGFREIECERNANRWAYQANSDLR